MKKLLIRILLGRKSEYITVLKIKGQLYEIRILPFWSAAEYLHRTEKALAEYGLTLDDLDGNQPLPEGLRFPKP